MDLRKDFIHQLWRYKNGSISRRHFLGTTGLGMATAVLAAAMPGLKPRRAFAGEIGDRVGLSTWPSYHDENNFKAFKEKFGAEVEVSVFGSNEEMMAKLQAGATGWDVIVPTNYTIRDYVSQKLFQPLDLAQLPAHDASAHDARFTGEGTVDGTVYAVPKDWGTTGYVVNTDQVKDDLTTWKQFWDATMTSQSGKVMVHDYQLTTIGNALKYYGYSFNSIDPQEMAEADSKLVPEGIEGRVAYKGSVAEMTTQLVGGLRSGMGYTGCRSIKQFQEESRFMRITSAGLRESHVHDVIITKEAPNYRLE